MNRRTFLAALGTALAAPFVPKAPIEFKTRMWYMSPAVPQRIYFSKIGSGKTMRGLVAVINSLPPGSVIQGINYPNGRSWSALHCPVVDIIDGDA